MAARYLIRAARESDLDALMALEESAFASDRLSRRAMRHAIRSAAQRVLIAEKNKQLAAAVIAGFRAGSALARISSIATHGSFAGQGLGRALLAACEDEMRSRGIRTVRLEVRADNDAALRLYERSGYRIFGRYVDYYEDGTDALRLEKSLL